MIASALSGTLVFAPALGQIELIERIVVFKDREQGGEILAICDSASSSTVLQQHGLQHSDVVHLKQGQFLVPGFVDLHVHAPQYSYTGTATDLPLMEWLDHYTFPRESRHREISLAIREYRALVKRLISNGTTTALYFATLRLQPTIELANVVEQMGQRGLIGKVCMDRMSPDTYIATCEENLADTEAFITAIKQRHNELVEPVITPRFVPTCTPGLLHGLGKLATKHNVHVQSHISESLDEVAFTKSLHPEVDGRDTPLLDEAGLLTSRCVMAHGVCLNDEELKMLAARGTALAHCPLSNFYFADVLLRVRRCLQLGVKVGLGTDVAGGYSPSMLSAIRNCVITSKALRMQNLVPGSKEKDPDHDLLDWKEAFYLATMGGAQALGIQDKVGSLEVGKQFDALLVDCTNGTTFDNFSGDTDLDAFEKFINLGDDRNIVKVWVKGAAIK